MPPRLWCRNLHYEVTCQTCGDTKIILKWVSNTQTGRAWTGFMLPRCQYQTVVNTVTNFLVSCNARNVLNRLGTVSFSRRTTMLAVRPIYGSLVFSKRTLNSLSVTNSLKYKFWFSLWNNLESEICHKMATPRNQRPTAEQKDRRRKLQGILSGVSHSIHSFKRVTHVATACMTQGIRRSDILTQLLKQAKQGQ